MVMFSTEMGEFTQKLGQVRNNEYILGYPVKGKEPIMKWEAVPDEEYSHLKYTTDELLEIYEGLSYTTNKDADKKLQKQINQSRAIRFFVLTSVCVLPVVFAYLGWANQYIGWYSFVYVLHEGTVKGLEVLGYLSPTKKDSEKAEEERLKEHHHYHCQRNPDGFNVLKLENFKNDSKQRRTEKLKRTMG